MCNDNPVNAVGIGVHVLQSKQLIQFVGSSTGL